MVMLASYGFCCLGKMHGGSVIPYYQIAWLILVGKAKTTGNGISFEL